MATPGRTKTGMARGAERRERILSVTRELIADHGVGGLRLNAVAERAGIGRPGLLHHFPNKDALLHAVLDLHEQTVGAALGGIAELGGLRGVRALADIARYDVHDRLEAAVWSELVSDGARADSVLHDRLIGAYESYLAGTRIFLEAAIADGDVRADLDLDQETILIIGMIRGLETSWLLDERVPLVELVERFLEQTIERLQP
jgi:AcrR family transcriptional regulator